MNGLVSLLISAIATSLIGAAAILAVQNYTPVSLRFLNYQSFEIPVGLVLAFSVGVGLLGTAIVKTVIDLPSGADSNDE